MSKAPLIKSIKINNLLSFGQNDEPLELESLNVLIGPNGSGKSNLIELICLLRATPKGIAEPIRHSGGIQEWLYKGKKKYSKSSIVTILNYPKGNISLKYGISLDRRAERVEIVDEFIENAEKTSKNKEDITHYYRFYDGDPEISELIGKHGKYTVRRFHGNEMHPEKSVLQTVRDEEHYPELTWIGQRFEDIRIYSGWSSARGSSIRQPQDTAAPDDFLLEDASNLNLILNNFMNASEQRSRVLRRLQRLYEGAGAISTKVSGGTIQLFLEEDNSIVLTPAARLSDGTLRYLALLAILCHPSPPPLICIEEPELGIHPDVILDVAALLKEASTRTQLIVTTHSPTLISALDDQPTAVVVAEKDKRGTKLKRLESERMKVWLERYSLGELWEKGEIGGNRW